MQRGAQPSPTGKKKTAWGKIYSDDASDSGTSTSSSDLGASLSSTFPLHRRSSASVLLQAATSGASLAAISELSTYLDSDIVNMFDDDFNILHWWHEHKLSYSVLSILARDVMTMPVSTIHQSLLLIQRARSSRSGDSVWALRRWRC